MKLIIVLFCLFALTFGQDETIEINNLSSDYCILRFGNSRSAVHHHKHPKNDLQGTCEKGFCCVENQCTKKCPRRKHHKD
uniref:Uncharacterized protein n=1 Tax=Panagrolaimus sp. ES5 TaxID=591445 RepID=A0AC34F1I9_9BILA